jgi:ATP-binding cassette subfamily B (MDR/TAP) protein 1
MFVLSSSRAPIDAEDETLQIAFFDREENSTGHLTSSIADWAQKIQGLFGITLGVIIQSICASLFPLALSRTDLSTTQSLSSLDLSLDWRTDGVSLSLESPASLSRSLLVSFVSKVRLPPSNASSWYSSGLLAVVVLKDAKNKQAHERSAQMACEAAGAIRTVASLTREDDCCEIYSGYLDEPQRVSNRTAIVANAYFSLSQSLTFWVIGLIFCKYHHMLSARDRVLTRMRRTGYGSHQLVDGYLTTTTFFITMISIVFGSIQAGNGESLPLPAVSTH